MLVEAILEAWGDSSNSKATGKRKVCLLLGRGRGEVEASATGNLLWKVERPVRCKMEWGYITEWEPFLLGVERTEKASKSESD